MRFSIFQEVLTAHSTLILFVMKMVRVRVSRNVDAIVILEEKSSKPPHLRLCWPWYKCPPDCIRVTCKDVL